jgi:diaminopimelate epimerase
MPDPLVDRTFLSPLDESIDLIENLEIRQFRATDAIRFFNNSAALSLRGYLVFTGEPHLVILSDNGFSLRDPVHHIFPTSYEESRAGNYSHRRMSTGSELVNFIGYYFVKNYRHIFPKGININFVRNIPGENIIEYRCFERGINKETLACGTGALACAFVMRSLERVSSYDIRLWPYRCRLHQQDAEIRVKKVRQGWQIFGWPTLLLEGRFAMKAAPVARVPQKDPAPSRPPTRPDPAARDTPHLPVYAGQPRHLQPPASGPGQETPPGTP